MHSTYNLHSYTCTVYVQYVSGGENPLPVKGQGGSCNVCLIILGKGETISFFYDIDFFFNTVFFLIMMLFCFTRKGRVTADTAVNRKLGKKTCRLLFGHLDVKTCLVWLIISYSYFLTFFWANSSTVTLKKSYLDWLL